MRNPLWQSCCLVTLLLSFARCAPGDASELTDVERSAIADTIRAQSEGWKSATERADANGLLSYYADTPEAAIIRANKVLVPVETLRTELPAIYAGIRSQALNPRAHRITVLARNVAAELATGDWVVTDTAGVVLSAQYAYARVWVRDSTGWRILHTYIDNARRELLAAQPATDPAAR